MLIVHVHIHVKDEYIEEFKRACIENASSSVMEPGIARFDVLQNNEDSARFVLNEVYRSAEAAAAHKETAHYKKWRDEVEKMMVEPRQSQKFSNSYPLEGSDW
jgi:quinol monooxygenase YgiN